MQPQLQKPITVKITIGLFGVLAFFSWVALINSQPGSTNTLVALLRAIPATAAFVGVLSKTRIGRIVAISVLFVLCLSGIFGLLVTARSFAQSPMLSLVTFVLVVAIFAWAVLYTFGAATRTYYSALFAKPDVYHD
ncbi:MAG TPA: hypothetical protein VEI74_05600 [Candidatus Methylomirabilis sp.]|nr:hypothetical protein [Candidatus Methylomirabilis sp.]